MSFDLTNFELLNKLKEVIVSDISNINVNNLTDFSLKSLNDVVTEKDFTLQNIVKHALKKVSFKENIYSEEDDLTNLNSQTEGWLLDPLDGTSNFVQGLQYQAISMAKVSNGKVVCALVIDLETLDAYTAIKGLGAQLNEESFVSEEPNIKLIGVSTGFIRKLTDNLNKAVPVPMGHNLRILGSQSLQLCFVAVGKLVGNFSVEAKAWDDIAGSLIINESGGSYTSYIEGEDWFSHARDGNNMKSMAFSKHASNDLKKFSEEVFND